MVIFVLVFVEHADDRPFDVSARRFMFMELLRVTLWREGWSKAHVQKVDGLSRGYDNLFLRMTVHRRCAYWIKGLTSERPLPDIKSVDLDGTCDMQYFVATEIAMPPVYSFSQ
jgi:phosphoribosyl-AMP cyclohydrolase